MRSLTVTKTWKEVEIINLCFGKKIQNYRALHALCGIETLISFENIKSLLIATRTGSAQVSSRTQKAL